MNALVANYGSDAESSGISDEDTVTHAQSAVKPTGNSANQDDLPSTNQQQKAVERKNLLMAESSSSDSDSDGQTIGESGVSKGDNSSKLSLPNRLAEKLPKPDLGVGEIIGPGSVFVNKFDKAEQMKQSILEKHVKMTANEHVKSKNVKICWKFRKGRCPFGKNCKYSHDMDSNLSLKYKESAESEQTQAWSSPSSQPHLPKIGFMGTTASLQNKRELYGAHGSFEEVDDDNYMASAKRKKRSGMAEALLPPKKAMSALQKQREEERPWTVRN